MAHTGRVWKDPHITVNSVDYSEHCNSIQAQAGVDIVEDPIPGQKVYAAGRKDLRITAKFSRGIVSAGAFAALWALHGTTTTVVMRQNKTAAISTDNIEFTAACIVNVKTPIGGQLDQIEEIEVEFAPTVVWAEDSTP